MSVSAGLLTLAILSDLAGWSDLAVLLGDGVLRSGYLGLVVFVLLKVAQGLAMFALVLRPLGHVRAVSNHRQIVQDWLPRGLSILAVGFWAAGVCGQIGLLTPATEVVTQVLGASIDIGALSVSLGDVVVFALTVWFSFLLARAVQVLLQEDVFSRVRTSRGVPYAVSNLARYSVICLGFLVGLAAAGVEVTKLAVVAGGLGVGIGFGLQNVVNNFVSGLILLFERPIDVGDTIELSDTSGTMKRIGIRASVIRTFDGAEVIVPNGMLISDKVTNWTLSDRRRRVDLNVGVEYGTPAQRVIDLLVDVAKANPKVIHDPEPIAFFENFGDSSLDFKLRAWFDADSSTNTHTIHSDIAVAVQQALEDASIGVPFPQRDLHLIRHAPHEVSDLGAPKPRSDTEQKP
jgi:small-conductance mechanosensitive channel